MKNKKYKISLFEMLFFLFLIPFTFETAIKGNNKPVLRHLEETFGEVILQFSKTGSSVLINVNTEPIENFDFYLKSGSSLTVIQSSDLSTDSQPQNTGSSAWLKSLREKSIFFIR